MQSSIIIVIVSVCLGCLFGLDGWQSTFSIPLPVAVLIGAILLLVPDLSRPLNKLTALRCFLALFAPSIVYGIFIWRSSPPPFYDWGGYLIFLFVFWASLLIMIKSQFSLSFKKYAFLIAAPFLVTCVSNGFFGLRIGL